MEEELLTRMILFVSNVSPELWEWALRAAHAEAVFNAVLAVVWTVSLVLSVLLFIWGCKTERGDGAPEVCGAFWGFVSLIAIMVTTVTATKLFSAPEFRALRILVEQAKSLLG